MSGCATCGNPRCSSCAELLKEGYYTHVYWYECICCKCSGPPLTDEEIEEIFAAPATEQAVIEAAKVWYSGEWQKGNSLSSFHRSPTESETAMTDIDTIDYEYFVGKVEEYKAMRTKLRYLVAEWRGHSEAYERRSWAHGEAACVAGAWDVAADDLERVLEGSDD